MDDIIPFIGEIRMFGGDFAPNGWLLCDGSLKQTADYGTCSAARHRLWRRRNDLRPPRPAGPRAHPLRRVAQVAVKGGEEKVTLTVETLPAHRHNSLVSGDIANSPNPSGSAIARSSQINAFLNANNLNEQSPRMADACISTLERTNRTRTCSPMWRSATSFAGTGIWPSPN